MYYVPAPQHAAGVDISDDAVTRYARVRFRHKTCVVVDDNAEELLRLIADQLSGKVVPLDDSVHGVA